MCKLSSRPVNGANIHMSTVQTDLSMDKNLLTFTHLNWNSQQSITFNPIYDAPGYRTSTDISIDYIVDAVGEAFDQCNSKITTSRKVDTLQTKRGSCME